MQIAGTATSTSTTTGAVIITGGLGVGGAVVASSFVGTGAPGSITGAGLMSTVALTATTAVITGTTAAISSLTGALTVAGGIGVVGSVYVGSNITATGLTLFGSEVVWGLRANGSTATTIASAATIAPTASVTFVSGTTQITTIIAPSPISATGGQITLIPTGSWTTAATGNIALATTAVVSKALIMTYDAGTAKWYPSY